MFPGSDSRGRSGTSRLEVLVPVPAGRNRRLARVGTEAETAPPADHVTEVIMKKSANEEGAGRGLLGPQQKPSDWPQPGPRPLEVICAQFSLTRLLFELKYFYCFYFFFYIEPKFTAFLGVWGRHGDGSEAVVTARCHSNPPVCF